MAKRTFSYHLVTFVGILCLTLIIGAVTFYFTTPVGADWFNEGWSYRVKITIDADQIGETLTDFPVYVDLSDLPAEFHANVRPDGGDIRIASADGTTELPREVVSYDADTDTGELHFKAPSLSSTTDTEFYIYYGNSEATDYATDATYGAENVWTNGYEGVWHMGIANPVDSTSNGNNGTNSGTTETSGVIGPARSFNGTNQYLEITRGASLAVSAQPYTISMWVNTSFTNDSNYARMLSWYDGSSSIEIGTAGNNLSNTGFYLGVTGNTTSRVGSSKSYAANSWYVVHVTHDGSGNYNLYVDGAEDDSNASAYYGIVFFSGNTSSLYIGQRGDGRYFPGALDEVKISNTSYSPAWIAAEYANQSSPDTFYSFGEEEAPSGDEEESSVPPGVGTMIRGGTIIRGGTTFGPAQ